MSNKKLGNDWEKECIDILGANDFFATKLQEREMGAPFDIIATKNNIFYAIEAKEILRGTIFDLNRIESNQRSSYKRLLKVNSKKYFFFFKTEEGNFVIDAKTIFSLKKKSIDTKSGKNIEEWIAKNCKKS